MQDHDSLWAAYQNGRTDAARNALFEFHWPWIQAAARKYVRNHTLGHLWPEILSALSIRFLTDVIPNHDPSRGPFEPRAHHCLLTTITDVRRQATFAPWKHPHLRPDRTRARAQLSHKLGHSPTDYELAEYLGIPEEEASSPPVGMASYKDFDNIEDPSLRRHLQNALVLLDTQTRAAFQLQVEGGLTVNEIADRLGISHRRALYLLHCARKFLRKLSNRGGRGRIIG